jgi:hypothetical protein
MSFQAMTWAVEQELPAMQKIVLLMMANRTSNDNGLCFPSHDKLAKDCGMEKRSVIRQIEKLESANLLTVIRSVDERGMKSVNKYRLHLDVKYSGSDTKSVPSDTKSVPSDTKSVPSDTKSVGGSDTKSHKTVNSFNQSINQSINQESDAPPKPEILAEKEPAKKWGWETDFDFTFALAYLVSKNRVSKDSTVDGISMDLWHKWMKSRKANKAKMTQTTLTTCLQDLIEINEAGLDANEAMIEAVKREWKSLDFWIEKKKKTPIADKKQPLTKFEIPDAWKNDESVLNADAIDSTVTPEPSLFTLWKPR